MQQQAELPSCRRQSIDLFLWARVRRRSHALGFCRVRCMWLQNYRVVSQMSAQGIAVGRGNHRLLAEHWKEGPTAPLSLLFLNFQGPALALWRVDPKSMPPALVR